MIFAREPQPGQVKTRLIPALGADGACQLHRKMLVHTVAQAQPVPGCGIQLWLTGEAGAFAAKLCHLHPEISVHRQRGMDLGQRMAAAFEDNFSRGYQRVIVAGSDCPHLSTSHFEQMLTAMQSASAVLVPALDGGYVALGMQSFDRALFEGIPWGESSVYQMTTQRLQDLEWEWRALDALPDIDRPEDLAWLDAIGFLY